MIAYCPTSSFRSPAEHSPLRCPATNEPLEYCDLPAFDPALIDSTQAGLWRYAAMLPVVAKEKTRLTLGEGWTSLIPDQWEGIPLHWKLDALMPTGSYKDRGVSVMMNWLIGRGGTVFVDDSSGNAGASVACYAATANLDSIIFVPTNATAAKKSQVAIYGTQLVEVPGPRQASADAAVAATWLDKGTKYASHALQPAYLLGQMTCAWEIWEQLGRRVPDWFVSPVGHGGLLLGTWRGFQQLHRAGLTDKLPRLVAVQAEPYTLLHEAFHGGRDRVTNPPPLLERISADGIAVTKPARSATLLAVLRYSRGTTISVNEEETLNARDDLAARGLFVEPTSATVGAALKKLRPQIQDGETVVTVLTGHGLKRPPEVW